MSGYTHAQLAPGPLQRRNFSMGINAGVQGTEYQDREKVTWQNFGNQLGVVYSQMYKRPPTIEEEDYWFTRCLAELQHVNGGKTTDQATVGIDVPALVRAVRAAQRQ